MNTYSYRCTGCGCRRAVQTQIGEPPRPRLGMYCGCCAERGLSADKGLPVGAQLFALETLPGTQVPSPEPEPEPEYRYQHPTAAMDIARLRFARWLFETGRISEGEGAPRAVQN